MFSGRARERTRAAQFAEFITQQILNPIGPMLVNLPGMVYDISVPLRLLMEVTEIVAGKAGWGPCVCVLTPQYKTNFMVTESRDSDTVPSVTSALRTGQNAFS